MNSVGFGATLQCLLNCTPEAGRVRLGDVESGVTEAGEVGVEEGKVVDLLQGGNVRVPLHNLLQHSGWVAIQCHHIKLTAELLLGCA